MIAIVDYGVGNLYSIQRSLNYIGAENIITGKSEELRAADKLLLPGVGAFSDAIAKLRSTGLDKVIIDEAKNGKPLLGICLGMQMLFDKSLEYGTHDGLGLIRGIVAPLFDEGEYKLKIPQIGWNGLKIKKPCAITKSLKDGDCVYFVHSYAAKDCDDSIVATTDYGREITAIVADGNIYGTQFHPEKSGEVGLSILKAFEEI